MQSRLSQTSSHASRSRWPRFNNNNNNNSNHPFETKPPSSMSKLRSRAGSILTRKRADTSDTRHSDEKSPSSPIKTGFFGRHTPGQNHGQHEGRSMGTPLKSETGRGDNWEEEELEDESLGRGFGVGQNMAPPEIPRV